MIDTDLDDIAPLATTDTDLASAASLAKRLLVLQAEKLSVERRLKEVNASIAAVAENDLPKALAACGWSAPSKGIIAGMPVRYDLKYRAGQLDDGPDKRERDGEPRRPLAERLKALDWIDKEGHGDIVKNAITVLLPRGSEELADQIVAYLIALGSNSMTWDRRRVVLWNTLSAFAKDLERQGDMPPLDMLGVSKVHTVKVTDPKEAERNPFDE